MMQSLRKNMRWIMLAIVVVFVLSLLVGFGGFSSGRGGEGDRVVAKINGTKVKLSEIERTLAQELQKMGQQAAQEVASTDYPVLRNVILDQIAVTKQLEKEVASRKIVVTKEEVDIEFNRIVSQFPTREIFMQQLESMGFTEASLKEDLKKQMSFSKVIGDAVADVSVDKKEIQDFYNTMKDYYFKVPEGYRLNIAQFTNIKAAKAFRGGLDATGSNWDKLVEGIASADLTGATPLAQPMLVPAAQIVGVTEVIKKTPYNKVAPIVEISSDDFIVAIPRSQEKARVSTFDEVSADVTEMLMRQAQEKKQAEFMEDLKSSAKIEKIDEEYFKVDLPSDDITEEKAVSEDQ